MQNEPPRSGKPGSADQGDDDYDDDFRREPRLDIGGGDVDADPEFPRLTGSGGFSAGERPTPPEPDIVYTPEEFEEDGSSMTRWLVGGGAVIALMLGALAAIWLSGSDNNARQAEQVAQAPVAAEPSTQPAAQPGAQPGAMTAPATVPQTSPQTVPPAVVPSTGSAIQSGQLPPASTSSVPGTTAQAITPAPSAPPAVMPAPTGQVSQAPVGEAPQSLLPPVATAPQTSSPVKSAPVKPAAKGAYGLQFAAVSERATADREIAKLKSAYPSALAGHAFTVESAQVSGKTLYRIVATGFASREAANTACSKIKASGGACFVRAPK